jgi:hypothetical protein|tara:strand:- start:284 stop:610 length:327 start_codon:yes stop_codon:yes gene_type:complete
MTKARDLSDIVSALSSNAGKAVIVKADGSELIFGDSGATEFYGFKYIDNDSDSFNETLQVTTTNAGADDIAVSNADNSATDLYDESFFASRNLTFSINQTTGNLEVTI